MTTKDVVSLAELLRIHNQTADTQTEFTPNHLGVLADFYAAQYPTLNRESWIEHIAGVNRDKGGPKSVARLKRDKKQQQNALQSLLRKIRRDVGLTQKRHSANTWQTPSVRQLL